MDIPDFLCRKKNPVGPATPEERAEYAARWPKPQAVSLLEATPDFGVDRKEERRQRSLARIRRLKSRVREGASLATKVPDEYLRWDPRRGKFYDAREKEKMIMSMARKIAEYNQLAAERGLKPRLWFKNLKAVQEAIDEMASPLAPKSDVPSTPGGVRGAPQVPYAVGDDGTTYARPEDVPLGVPVTTRASEAMTATQKKETAMKTEKKTKTKTAAKKATVSKMASGQEPNAAAFKQVRAGTKRARILELMDGTRTAEQIGGKVGLDAKGVLSHAYCLTRDCGIGYSIKDGKVKSIYPQGQSFARAIKRDQ